METNKWLKTLAIVVPIVASIILGVIWVETRYQHVDTAVCQISRSALDMEVLANEIRIEFYNKELLDLITGDGDEHKIRHLEASTLSISARLRVIKTELKAKAC